MSIIKHFAIIENFRNGWEMFYHLKKNGVIHLQTIKNILIKADFPLKQIL